MSPSLYGRWAEPPRIVARGEGFLVVEKPAHILVHPTKPTGEPTLLDWLRDQEPGAFRALVQRLDRETSGLLLAATTPEAASLFGKMLMRHEVRKEYLAIVTGHVAAEHEMIDAPLGREGINATNPLYMKQAVLEGGAAARTEFWRVWAGEAFSLLRVRTHTGRLHQIRVHLAHRGHPLVGDKVYGPDPHLYLRFIETGWTPELASALLLPRHALHASRLEFEWIGEVCVAESPLPADLQAFLLGQGYEASAEPLP